MWNYVPPSLEQIDIYLAYVEDLWSVTSRLNLIIGLRYDDNLSKGGSDR
jgi:outer membrane receptor protein involved in Fe transport